MKGSLYVKIYLPTGQKVDIDNSLSLEDKMEVVDSLIREHEEYIIENWDNKFVKFFLENLANYLVWHKMEAKNKEDKEILSMKKLEKMNRGGGMINFSQLGESDRERLGLVSVSSSKNAHDNFN
jgi:hypothetical protein